MSERQPPNNDTDDLIDLAEAYVQPGKENLTQVAHALVHGHFRGIPPKQQGIMITDEFLGHVAAMGPVEASNGDKMAEIELLRLIKAVGTTHDATVMPRTNGMRFALVMLADDGRTNHSQFWDSPELRTGAAGTPGFASLEGLRGYLQGSAHAANDEINEQWANNAFAEIETMVTGDGAFKLTAEWWKEAERAGVDLDRVRATVDRLRLAHRAPKDLGKTSVDAVTTKLSTSLARTKRAV